MACSCQFAPDSVASDASVRLDAAIDAIGRADDAPDVPDGLADASGFDAFTCPAGYDPAGPERCLRAVTASPLPWFEAELTCEGAGAHLVVVGDAAEDASLPDNVWIGFTERVTAGTFIWVTRAEVGYTGWASGQPAAGGGLCTEARPDGWHDDGCAEAKAYLCELDRLPADPTAY